MKSALKLGLGLCLFFAVPGLFAQSGTIPTGGDASGSGGSVSYSIGQIDYQYQEATTGKVNQGLQVPYEIYIETGIKETGIDLNLEVYPNPTSNRIVLIIDDWKEKMSYTLYDSQGKLLLSEGITNSKTELNLSSYSASTYLLNVADESQLIKTFRIIKKH